MLTFVSIIYIFMCWISNWNIIWPISMVTRGGLGDKLIAFGWTVMFITAL